MPRPRRPPRRRPAGSGRSPVTAPHAPAFSRLRRVTGARRVGDECTSPSGPRRSRPRPARWRLGHPPGSAAPCQRVGPHQRLGQPLTSVDRRAQDRQRQSLPLPSQPAASAGSIPARTRLDLPAPEGRAPPGSARAAGSRAAGRRAPRGRRDLVFMRLEGRSRDRLGNLRPLRHARPGAQALHERSELVAVESAATAHGEDAGAAQPRSCFSRVTVDERRPQGPPLLRQRRRAKANWEWHPVKARPYTSHHRVGGLELLLLGAPGLLRCHLEGWRGRQPRRDAQLAQRVLDP